MRRKQVFLANLFFLFLLLSFTQVFSQEKYSRVKVYANAGQLNALHAKGISFDELAERTGSYIIGDFSSREIALMNAAKTRVDVIIPDLTQDFLKRNKEASVNTDNMRTGGTPPGFSYGSMGGYLTYAQMVTELDELKTMYPNLITTKSSIGTSIEGRQLWMVKISDNPDTEEASEEGVFYSGLYHAREPISMVNLIYFMQYILSRYGTDPEITCLINNRELYFVPCVNPDGYVYNETTNPNGGGFWRKNRRNNGNGTFGVDLNRNFPYNWGFDNTGSSPITTAEDYRGTAASSEPEIVAVQNFVNNNQLTIAMNNHTYGNKVILPFEFNSSQTSNETHYNNVAALLTADNNFQYGKQVPMVGYAANGTVDDWMYGSKGLYSFTVETSHDSDGFWPVQAKIIPTCEKNLDMNIAAAWGAGNYIRPTVQSNLYVTGLTYNLPISITNYGNTLGTLETVTLSINDPKVLLYDITPILVTGLLPDATINVFKNITFSPLATNGTVNANLIVTNIEGCTYTIPFSFEYSPTGCFPIPLLWSALDIGIPGLVGSSCLQNGIYTVKGSGTGIQQTSDKFHFMKLTNANSVYDIKVRLVSSQNTAANARAGISIAESTAPGSKRVSLVYNPANAKFEFQVRAATNGSLNIQNASNVNIPKWLRITKGTGGFWNAYFSTDGVNWMYITKQKVSMNTNVFAGLMVTSGSALLLNTATFDNLVVTHNTGSVSRSAESASELEAESAADKFSLYPNPSKGTIEVRLPVSSGSQTISVFDIKGRLIASENITSNYKRLNLAHLSNGLYYIRYKEGTKVKHEKFIINK